jgi:hypothetical protein
MTSAVTNVAMPPTPVFAHNAEPQMAADGTAAPVRAGSDASAIATSQQDPRQSEDTKSAQIGVQVPNALLGILIANTSNPTAPHIDPAAAFADFAANVAASSTNNESAVGSSNSSGDSGAPQADSPVRETSVQGTGTPPNSKGSSPPVHIIPSWHVIPRMRIV